MNRMKNCFVSEKEEQLRQTAIHGDNFETVIANLSDEELNDLRTIYKYRSGMMTYEAARRRNLTKTKSRRCK